MSRTGAVPDAWYDDWVPAADKPAVDTEQPAPAPKLNKAQRRAQHLEQQKQLWDSADNNDRFNWLEAQGVVPLKQEFKPQVTLLSRKPAATVARRDPGARGTGTSAQDDEDSEEEARKKREAELEDRQRQAKLDREEKQRRYAEARERIMGSTAVATSASLSRESSQGRDNRRNKGRQTGSRRSQPESPVNQSPARANNGERQLFDPLDISRRSTPQRESLSTPREDQPMRQPRGPDSSGRGGFGFAKRGGMTGA